MKRGRKTTSNTKNYGILIYRDPQSFGADMFYNFIFFRFLEEYYSRCALHYIIPW